MGIYKSKEVLKQVIVRKPDHKLQIKITVDISTHALEWVKFSIKESFKGSGKYYKYKGEYIITMNVVIILI